MDEEELKWQNPDGTPKTMEEIEEQYNATSKGQTGAAQRDVAEEQATNGRLKTSKKTKDVADKKEKPKSKLEEVQRLQDEEFESRSKQGKYVSPYNKGEAKLERKQISKANREARKAARQEKIAQRMLNKMDAENGNVAPEGEPNYNHTAAETAKANGLSKYVNEDGTVDFDRLEKSKTGWKILSGLGNAMAAFAKGMTGVDFAQNSGIAADQLNRRKEIQDKYKEAQQKKLNDVTDMDTFNKKADKQHEQSKEMAQLHNDLAIDLLGENAALSTEQEQIMADYMAELARKTNLQNVEDYSHMTAQQKAEYREVIQQQLPFMEYLKRRGADTALGLIPGLGNKNNSDEGVKHFARRSVFR